MPPADRPEPNVLWESEYGEERVELSASGILGIVFEGPLEERERADVLADTVRALAGRLELVAKARDAALERAVAAEAERDLAIAHDRQPYPTADAYERVCAALAATKAERDEARTQALEEAHNAVEMCHVDQHRNILVVSRNAALGNIKRLHAAPPAPRQAQGPGVERKGGG